MDNLNKGAIFKNENKKEQKHPDYKGKINWNGKEIEISLWVAEAKNGNKYFSAKLQEPFVKQTTTIQTNDDDGLPF